MGIEGDITIARPVDEVFDYVADQTNEPQDDIRYVLRFEPAPAGTRMSWSGHVRPKGALRLLGPLIVWLGRRQEERIWQSMKLHLEHERAGAT